MCILTSKMCDGRRYDCSDNSDEDNPECRESSLGRSIASCLLINLTHFPAVRQRQEAEEALEDFGV